MECKFPQICIDTGMIFFHKYFLFKKKFADIETKYLCCFACLFISLKVNYSLIPLKNSNPNSNEVDLITIFTKLLFKIQERNESVKNEEVKNKFIQLILIYEFEILDLIGFDLNIDHPKNYHQKYLFYFEEYLKIPQFYKIIFPFINDSFTIPLILYHHPLVIYLASVYFNSKLLGFKLPDCNGKKWFQLLDNQVSLESIIDICKKMQLMYNNSQKYLKCSNIEFRHPSYAGKNIIDFEFDASESFEYNYKYSGESMIHSYTNKTSNNTWEEIESYSSVSSINNTIPEVSQSNSQNSQIVIENITNINSEIDANLLLEDNIDCININNAHISTEIKSQITSSSATSSGISNCILGMNFYKTDNYNDVIQSI